MIDNKTLVVIDEAGISGISELESVFRSAHEAAAKVICFGDRRQLQAVAGRSALRVVADVVARGAVLSQVRRQTVTWQQAASMVMARGDSEAGLRAYAQQGKLEFVPGEVDARARVIEIWKQYRQTYGEDVMIITRRNSDAAILNRAARDVLRAGGHLVDEDVSLVSIGRDKKVGPIEVAQGDRISVWRKSASVSNS